MRNIWLDGMMGLVIGDALGNPVQFSKRWQIKKHGSVTGMESGGVFQTPAGTWTDDSSMAMATLDSIITCNAIDCHDIMRNFMKWLYHGEFTPFGKAFDQGGTCTGAIADYAKRHDWRHCGRTGEFANGNGGLMRILPACLFCIDENMGEDIAVNSVHAVTALTHNHIRALVGSGIYYFLAKEIVNGAGDRNTLLQNGIRKAWAFYQTSECYSLELKHYARLLDLDDFSNTPEHEINSSGYVVDTLEAAVWSLLRTDSFRDALLLAVNLGDDADTVGAVVGGLAGLYYGYDSVPQDWKNVLQKREWIEGMCDAAEIRELPFC